MSQKSRLTITLPKQLLKRVDFLVDKKVIRNRSHAIEHLIEQSLVPIVKRAVILSWGDKKQGEQHSLKMIHEKPVLSLMLEQLRSHGIEEVIICAGKSNSEIKKILNEREIQGLQIRFVAEETPLGTAGALKKAEKFLQGAPFLVLHGDTLTKLNMSEFLAFHADQKTFATIAVKPRLGEERYGQVYMQGNKITRFFAESTPQGISIINTGIYVLEPQIFSMISAHKRSTLEEDVFPILAEKKELSAFIFQGLWYDISEQKEYQKAQERW